MKWTVLAAPRDLTLHLVVLLDYTAKWNTATNLAIAEKFVAMIHIRTIKNLIAACVRISVINIVPTVEVNALPVLVQIKKLGIVILPFKWIQIYVNVMLPWASER